MTKNKELYEGPQTEVVEVITESMVCVSSDYTGFGNEEVL